jgi:chromosome segregation ATPase
MAIKDFWTKTKGMFSGGGSGMYDAALNDDGLICEDVGSVSISGGASSKKAVEIVRSTAAEVKRRDNNEVMNEAFNRLVEKLEGINDNLGKQVAQHEELMGRIDKLPEVLQALPDAVANQGKVVESLTEQLKTRQLKDAQLLDAIEKIPNETAKQSDSLAEMSRKFSVSADTSVQMAQSFNKFNDALTKLDTTTDSQTDGIKQMAKTFAASDRYLKYIVSKQQRRFMWMIGISLTVGTLAIAALIATLIMTASS